MPPRSAKISKKPARISKASRAGTMFSVARIRRNLRAGHYAKHVGVTASVYLAAVIEYLVAEILDMAVDVTRQIRKKRVTPRCVQLAVRCDEELAELMAAVTIPGGGVRPWIHGVLLPKKKGVKVSSDAAPPPLSS